MKRAPLIALSLVAMVAAGAAALAVTDGDGPSAPPPPPIAPLTVTAGPGRTEISAAERTRIAGSDQASRAWLDAHRTIRGTRITAEVMWTPRDARVLARAAASTAPALALAPRVNEVSLHLPVIKQAYRNNCETAALSMALRGAASQRALQAAIPQALPLDPQQGAGGTVWGDPDAGFVGRVEGGGFGVFERPLVRVGARYDPGIAPVRATSFEGVLDRVRAGQPVVAWTGLGSSAPWTWTTAGGRVIDADRSHHTVVIAGVGPNGVTIHDPWTGSASVVSRGSLAAGWERLGRRAVATSPLQGMIIASDDGSPRAPAGATRSESTSGIGQDRGSSA